jgi:hypothetical protein
LKKKEKLDIHVGNFNGAHNQAWRSWKVVMHQKQHTEVVIGKHLDLIERMYI